MLSASNASSNFQQQQNMMQYLQQQQYLQQNFPHQQMSVPTQYQPPVQQTPLSTQVPMPGQALPQGMTQGLPQSALMASINTMAASIIQPQSYNTANPPQRPAPVHLGAPFGAASSYHTGADSGQNYEGHRNQHHQQQQHHQHQQTAQHLPQIQAQHPSQLYNQPQHHQGQQYQGQQHQGHHGGQADHSNGQYHAQHPSPGQNPYMNQNQQYQQSFQQQQVQQYSQPQYQQQPYNASPVNFPVIPSAQPAPHQQQQQNNYNNYSRNGGPRSEPVQDISPTTKEPAVAESPKHGILKHNQLNRSGSDDAPPTNRHTMSSQSNASQANNNSNGHIHGAPHKHNSGEYVEPAILLTGRSSFESVHGMVDSSRLGTGQTTPGGHNGGSAVKMPSNRIVRKGTNKLLPVESEAPEAEEALNSHQQRHLRNSNDSNDGLSTPGSVKFKPGSSSSSGMGATGSGHAGGTPGSQHAFMQNIMTKQAQAQYGGYFV